MIQKPWQLHKHLQDFTKIHLQLGWTLYLSYRKCQATPILMKVLIIEDEKALSESILAYLHSEHYTCETAADFRSAMEKISCYDYACIILDITLPGGSGLDMLRELKEILKPMAFSLFPQEIHWTKKFLVSSQVPMII